MKGSTEKVIFPVLAGVTVLSLFIIGLFIHKHSDKDAGSSDTRQGLADSNFTYLLGGNAYDQHGKKNHKRSGTDFINHTYQQKNKYMNRQYLINEYKDTQAIFRQLPSVHKKNRCICYALEGCTHEVRGDRMLRIHIPKNIHKGGKIYLNDKKSTVGVFCPLTKWEIKNKKVAVVNFANYDKCGGGVKNGRNAQEESLYRVTNAGQFLEQNTICQDFYEKNHKLTDLKKALASDRVLVLKDVLILKNEYTFQKYNPKSARKIDVISVAAPNWGAKGMKKYYKSREEITRRRILAILQAAIEDEVDVLSLGAFGCGVYKGDPYEISKIFYDLLVNGGYRYCFDKVVFSIYDKGGKCNFKVFDEKFRDVSERV